MARRDARGERVGEVLRELEDVVGVPGHVAEEVLRLGPHVAVDAVVEERREAARHGARGAGGEAERLEELDPREELVLDGEGEQVGAARQVRHAERAEEVERGAEPRGDGGHQQPGPPPQHRGRSSAGTPASSVKNRSAAVMVPTGTDSSSGHIPRPA